MGIPRRQTLTWFLAAMLSQLVAGMAVQAQQSQTAQLPTSSSSMTSGDTSSSDSGFTAPAFNSGVSWIDSAFPQTQLRILGDFGFDAVKPQRAEFIWAQGIAPGTPGPPLPETRLAQQQLSTYAEMAFEGWVSVFLETPYVWMNPENNANTSGYGDMNAGFKLMAYGDENLQLTLQLRAYFPTGTAAELGTHHYTLEPALLGHYNLMNCLQLEGEFRYWAPIGGTDFAGNMIRYGFGVSYGQRSANEIWLMPVAEVVGWTVLSGKTYEWDSPTTYSIQDAAGTTIINAMVGLRIGFGNQFDIYAGYGRGLTSEKWFQDNVRVELRIFF